eukprot:scaffold192_cov320-Ochromonas_danica.AAC.31
MKKEGESQRTYLAAKRSDHGSPSRVRIFSRAGKGMWSVKLSSGSSCKAIGTRATPSWRFPWKPQFQHTPS